MWTPPQRKVFFWTSLFVIAAVGVTIYIQLRQDHGEKGLSKPIPMSEVKEKANTP
jgi:hypothetical protein